MIVPSKFNGYTKDGVRRLYMGGGGGGGSMQSTNTTYTTNIPEYAKPYVETMLGATQRQLFNGKPQQETITDESGAKTTRDIPGTFDITGFKPYQAYGGTYDEQGKQLSYDPNKAIAGFQPLQEKAQAGVGGMRVPGQFRQGMDITGAGIRGALGTAGQAAGLSGLGYEAAGAGDRYAMQATNPYATQAYMSPYMQNVVDVQNREAMRNSQIAGTQQQGEATRVGAFGGSRDAIMRAERERNLATTMNQNQAQGLQSAFQQAQQAQQYGANLGLQGLQAGMQGVGAGIGAQQAAYNQAMQGGQQLAGLGQQQLAAQQGIYNLQNQFGGQQQALEQAKVNQAMQDYANAQQYPLMQLGTMSNMLRGLPMQAQSTQQYVAAPNQLSQAIGTIGSGASIYNAFNPSGRPPGQAAGGEVKGYAKGGIMSYDMGGEVEAQLENMDEKGLQAQARESSSPSIRRMAQRILRERQMSEQPKGTGPMGVQYQASATPGLRGGGIIAFAKGDTVYGGPSSEADAGEAEARIDMEKRLAMPPATGGILGAGPVTAAPTTPVPTAPAGPLPDIAKEAMRQRDIYTAQANRPTIELMKEIEAEREAMGLGQNKAREDYRAQQMAERANMKDEQERQKHLRLAEFFANWGSTPGPTLVAGMNALKQSIPGIVSDEKEAKKARREADKIIYDIDEATRLEKLGQYDKATALKEKAAGRAEDYNKYLLTLQAQREANERAIEAANIQAASSKYVADTQAKSQSAATAQRGQEVMFANVDRALQGALRRQAEIEKDIETTRSRPPKGSPLAKAMDTANLYNSLLSKSGGDASKLDAITRKNGEQALETINKFETNAARRLRDAESRVQTFENLFDTAGRGSKPGAKSSSAKDDPYDIMDILKQESPASAAAPTGGTTKLASKPTKTTAEVPTNTLTSNPYRETGRGRTGVDQAALRRDLEEYNDLKDSKLSVAAGRRTYLEKKLRAAGALED